MEVSILNALIENFCLFSIDGQKHVNRVQYAYHHLLFGLICIDSELNWSISKSISYCHSSFGEKKTNYNREKNFLNEKCEKNTVNEIQK